MGIVSNTDINVQHRLYKTKKNSPFNSFHLCFQAHHSVLVRMSGNSMTHSKGNRNQNSGTNVSVENVECISGKMDVTIYKNGKEICIQMKDLQIGQMVKTYDFKSEKKTIFTCTCISSSRLQFH